MKQLVTYFILAYLISWITWFPLYAPAFGLKNVLTISYQHAIGALGPLIASFLTTWVYHKKEGIRRLVRNCFKLRPFAYLMIALLGPFLLALVAAICSLWINKTPFTISALFKTREFPGFSFLTFLIYNIIFFGFGEEVGWRGFALPALQTRMHALSASVVLTILWAGWHLPLFFYRQGYTTMNFEGIFGWIFSLLTGSVLLTWLFNSSRGSIFICAIFHSTVDIAFTADAKDIVNYMGVLITVWGIAIILIFKPKNLSNAERIKAPNENFIINH